MSQRLSGRSGFVTGAANGIGRGVALELAREGAAIVVTDLPQQEEAGWQTVELIKRLGAEATFVAVDVTQPDQVEALAAATTKSFGTFNFAVNNAGVAVLSSFAELTQIQIDLMIDVNLKGVIYGTRSAINAFIKEGTPGSVVNISSVAGERAVDGLSVYSATKHGVIGVTKNAAKEYGGHGIRVNAILPNAIRTPLADTAPPEFIESLIAPQTIKRMGEPAEVGYAAAFLISDRALFVTGTSLPVDGGYLA